MVIYTCKCTLGVSIWSFTFANVHWEFLYGHLHLQMYVGSFYKVILHLQMYVGSFYMVIYTCKCTLGVSIWSFTFANGHWEFLYGHLHLPNVRREYFNRFFGRMRLLHFCTQLKPTFFLILHFLNNHLQFVRFLLNFCIGNFTIRKQKFNFAFINF